MHSVPVRHTLRSVGWMKGHRELSIQACQQRGILESTEEFRAESGLLEANCGALETSSGVRGVRPLSLYSFRSLVPGRRL